MDASERKKAENEMTDKERELYTSIKAEGKFLDVVLKLATVQQDPERLGRILYNLQIGNKRDSNKDLKGFIKKDGSLKNTHKEAFYEVLKDNDEKYKKIQEVICDKLNYTEEEIEEARREKEESTTIEIEDPRGTETEENLDKETIIASLLGRRTNESDTKNSFDDFKTDQVKKSLKSSLTTIKTSLAIIEENLEHIDISTMQPGSQDAKSLANLVRRSKTTSSEWLEYLVDQKLNKKFMLHEDVLLNLFNETIEPAKRTWELATMMEQEMKDAGLITEEELQQIDEENSSATFYVDRYWSDDPVRTAKIQEEIDPEETETTYADDPAYEQDKKTFLKYKYFDDVSRTKRDMEKAEKGLGLDFRVTKRELTVTNVMRKMLSGYYKIPEDMRDMIEKATKSFGVRGNNTVTAIFSFLIGRASKDPEIIFTGMGPGPSARERHRDFVNEVHHDNNDHRGEPHHDPEGHEHRDHEDHDHDDEGREP